LQRFLAQLLDLAVRFPYRPPFQFVIVQHNVIGNLWVVAQIRQRFAFALAEQFTNWLFGAVRA
jgi:hypothetical protein